MWVTVFILLSVRIRWLPTTYTMAHDRDSLEVGLQLEMYRYSPFKPIPRGSKYPIFQFSEPKYSK